MTTGTKSGVSNDGAVRSNSASSNFHVGDHSRQSSLQSSRRFFSRPARPRSVLKYHWYQNARSWATGARRHRVERARVVRKAVEQNDGDAALSAVGLVGDLEGGRAHGQGVRHGGGNHTRGADAAVSP